MGDVLFFSCLTLEFMFEVLRGQKQMDGLLLKRLVFCLSGKCYVHVSFKFRCTSLLVACYSVVVVVVVVVVIVALINRLNFRHFQNHTWSIPYCFPCELGWFWFPYPETSKTTSSLIFSLQFWNKWVTFAFFLSQVHWDSLTCLTRNVSQRQTLR